MVDKIFGAILVIIIIILVLMSFGDGHHKYVYDKLLNGFYESDTSFCEEAGIDMFCLYIDDDVDYYGNRAVYILMHSNDKLILNEPTVAKITPHGFSNMMSPGPDSPKFYNIEFKDLSDECADIFPHKQIIRFYPIIGKIVMYTEENVITGVFYKNCTQTELKSIMKDDNVLDDETNEDE